MIGLWNAASAAYAKKNGWDDQEGTNKIMIVSSITIAGAIVGASISSSF